MLYDAIVIGLAKNGLWIHFFIECERDLFMNTAFAFDVPTFLSFFILLLLWKKDSSSACLLTQAQHVRLSISCLSIYSSAVAPRGGVNYIPYVPVSAMSSAR